MKKLLLVLGALSALSLSLAQVSSSQIFNPGGGSATINVQELDGAPNVSGVTTIKVTNGSLTDNTGGVVTLATAAANITIGTSSVTGGVASSFLYTDAGPTLRQVSITGLVLGNGASIPTVYGGVTCTNQVLRVLSAAGAGTCNTITSAFVDNTVWTGTVASGMLKATAQGTLAAGTKGTDYVDVGTANSWTAGIKQTFAPNTTTSGLNFGSFAGDPSAPADGDAVYNGATPAFRFRENGAWRGLGIAAETLDLQGTFALGKSITGANSKANCMQVGDGVTPLCLYTDATLGPMVRPKTDANILTVIASTFTYKIWDEAGALSMEEIKPSGATPDLMWQYINAAYRPKGTVSWNADAMHVDGTQCGQPTERILNSGAPMSTIICTNNAASSIYGQVEMPDKWDGGALTFMWDVVQTAADTAIMNSHIAAACRASGDTINNTWGTLQTLNIAAVGGSNKKDRVTSAALTPNGTCTGNGTLLQWRWQLDTSTTTAVATLHNIAMKMEFSTKSRSD